MRDRQNDPAKTGRRTNRSREDPEKPPIPSSAQTPLWKDLLFLLIKIAAIALAILLLLTFMYGFVRGPDASMKPAIRNGDLILYYRLDKHYVQGDVLLLQYEEQTQIRRVVATAGDTVEITTDGLVVNGALQQEPDIYGQTEPYVEGITFPLTLVEGQVFVLGDAREGATDSRIYGAVNTEDTLGKVITILRRRNI